MTTLFIADVSDFQGTVDWDAYKASGRVGAITKVSEGLTFKASTFKRNRDGMAGLALRGLYHFGHQANDPRGEARHFCDLVGRLAPGEVGILDAEHTVTSSGAHVVGPDAEWCLAWAAAVTERLGAKPALYFSESYFSDRLGSDPRLAKAFRFFWVAAYRQSPRPTIKGIQLWQSTDGTKGRVRDVPGVPGLRCDDNEFEGTITDLARLADNNDFPFKESDIMRIIGVKNRGIFLVGGTFDRTTGKAVARLVSSPTRVEELVKSGVVTDFNKDDLGEAAFDEYFVVV
jgi:GH25 family lysozyme M1 (1,4-beta-N-acetylmuramidase)